VLAKRYHLFEDKDNSNETIANLKETTNSTNFESIENAMQFD
jgi:hypothetical protein